jgi:hypothetical protein
MALFMLKTDFRFSKPWGGKKKLRVKIWNYKNISWQFAITKS